MGEVVSLRDRQRTSYRPGVNRHYDTIHSFANLLLEPQAMTAALELKIKTDRRFQELKQARKGGAMIFFASFRGGDHMLAAQMHNANRREKHKAMLTALQEEQAAIPAAVQGALGRDKWRDMNADVGLPHADALQRQVANSDNDQAWRARITEINKAFARSPLWHLVRARTFLNKPAQPAQPA